MLSKIIMIAGGTITLVNTIREPLEFVVSTLENAADKLEKLAEILEENIPRKE